VKAALGTQIMSLQVLSRFLSGLLLYFVCLLLVFGGFGEDVVSNIAAVFFLYGVPPLIFILAYMARMALEVRALIKTKTANLGLVTVVSMKMGIALMPMFFFDNRLASLLVGMRLS
jgi:hypothetical protein